MSKVFLMKRILLLLPFLFFIIFFFSSCSRTIKTQVSVTEESKAQEDIKKAGPPVIIYKTKEDYFDKVPVTLSENRDQVISYPSQKDIISGDGYSYPTPLAHGFLLDNRGVGKYSAFLDISYEAYSMMNDNLSADPLFFMIIDHDPFIEMYHCGSRFEYKDLINELNRIIEKNELDKCIQIR
jgi:hypothetical protein